MKKIVLFILLLTSCASYHSIDVPKNIPPDLKTNSTYNELISSVEKIVNAGGNHNRKKAILKQLETFGLEEETRQERIDWFSAQKNIIVDLPGKSDSLVYVVAHYDKTDVNPLKLMSIYVNGLLDPLISWSFTSQGAVDNATGVAIAIQLAKALKEADTDYSYRILLAGSEESGLRGSRAHVARLSTSEFEKIKYVINIDVIGVKGKQNCIYELSDEKLKNRAILIADEKEFDLGRGKMSLIAASDYLPFKKTSFGLDFSRSFIFNLPGSFLPQRSYFTKRKSTKVVNFSSCELLSILDSVSALAALPIGTIHGFRDNIKQVDSEKLHEMYQLTYFFLLHNEE